MDDMKKMSLRELRSLACFEIENEHGKIKFKAITKDQGVDITNVNLARDVAINPKSVEVYENDDDGSVGATASVKPNYGCKLNLPSVVTLNRVPPAKNRTPAE